MSLKILFVDDETDFCIIFSDIFSSSDIWIKTVCSGEEAIAECAKTRFDIIFIDYRMPLNRGDEVAKKLPADIPKYLLTGEADPTISYPFAEILAKPLEYDKIGKILSSYLEK